MEAEPHPMDAFCGSQFWSSNRTWYTDDPDFTPCFEQTVLVWAPCAFLWLLSILELYYLRSSLDKNIPWNKKNLTKLALNIALLVLVVVDFVKALVVKGSTTDVIFPVDVWGPVIKFFTYALAASFIFLNRKFGVQTSGTLFTFWFFTTIFGAIRCRTEVREYNDRHGGGIDTLESREDENSWADYKYVSFMISFAFSIVILFVNCFADDMPRETKYNRSKNETPELSASFLSRITYTWFDKMAWLGYRQPLEEKDLWDLRPQDSSKEVMPIFAKHWNKNVLKNYPVENRAPKAQYSNGNVTFENPHGSAKKGYASILPPIVKSFGGIFLFGASLKLVSDLLTFAQPQVLRLIIGYVEINSDGDQEDQPEWKGIFYAFLLFIIAAIQTFFLGQYFQKMFIVGLRIRTSLINAIYRKALIISNSTKKESTVGEIVNLMAVDAQRFMELTTYLNMIWSAPLQIGLAIYFLWDLLGPSVLAGLAVMIILIPINGVIANRIKILQIKQMKYKDERVKLMNEVLSGIKVLKLYAWEPSFESQVLQIRTKEIETLKSAAYLNAGTSFLWSCAPFLVSMATFACYVLVDDENQLTAEKVFVGLTLFEALKLPLVTLPMLMVDIVEVSLVTFATYVMVDENNVLDPTTAFVSLSLFNILRFPLAMLPMLITNMVQTQVSVKRINKFMNSEELDPECVGHDPSEKDPMLIENGSFSWGGDVPTLKNINIRIKTNNLVAIVGTVGSGKSSVVAALLGEMEKLGGRVNTVGTIAYVPQQAWIQNATLRDNILFGKPYDKKLYQKVIDACALRADIDMLSAGDKTEIGEKGINLSGGQKQRISLARAVYSDSDLYLLDDPLSAVDSHVGKHIFDEVVGPNGILAKKTRVLVTHGITFLPKVDHIYVIKDGEVSEDGTYAELLSQKGAFAEFLIQHLQEGTDGGEDLEEIKQQLGSTINSEELLGQFEEVITRARKESVSETASIGSAESLEKGGSSVRRRKPERQSSKASSVSVQSEQKSEKADGKLIETEKAQTGGVDFAVYKHYIRSIGVALAVSTILLNFVFQVFQIGSNLWLTKWSNDKDVANDTGKRDLYLGVYGAFGFGQVATYCMATLAIELGSVLGSKRIFRNLFGGIIRAPCSFFDTLPKGRILDRLANDVYILDAILPPTLRAFLSQAFRVLATIVVISISTPIFLAAIVPIGAIYYFAQRFYVATSRQLMRLESVSRSPIYSHFGETVTGVSTIRAYNVNSRFIDESDERVDKNQVCKYPSIIANRWLAIRLEMVGNLIILFASLFAVLGGQTNPGLVGLSVSYALQVTQTLNWLVRMTSDIETNIVAVERIKEYGETKQEAAWELDNVKMHPNWPQNGRVVFEDFKVRYREGLDLVLKGISFDVAGGEKVGIVGRTGAGKSSLTLSLFRIIESASGRILIDDIDIASLGLHMLRSRLTIIPQDPVLFSGTLRMNLDPFERNTDEEIWKALELAHLKTFVKGMSAGLNHEINEGGENLSVGQRQLVCLARALLRKTKVLVLDEATAAVDLETDDLIQKTIRSEFKDCTVLTIAHRLNTILDSDKVIVLDKGKIIEFDTPTNLLNNSQSAFYSMAKDANLV